MTEMTDQLLFQTIGSPRITLAVLVKTAQKYDWLRKLNDIEHIHAAPGDQLWIGKGDETLVDFTYLLVSVSTTYKSHAISGEIFIRDALRAVGLEVEELTP